MAKATTKPDANSAPGLTVRERLMLFCAASGTDWQNAGLTGENVTGMIVKGLIERDAGGQLSLTDRGRIAFRRLLPDL